MSNPNVHWAILILEISVRLLWAQHFLPFESQKLSWHFCKFLNGATSSNCLNSASTFMDHLSITYMETALSCHPERYSSLPFFHSHVFTHTCSHTRNIHIHTLWCTKYFSEKFGELAVLRKQTTPNWTVDVLSYESLCHSTADYSWLLHPTKYANLTLLLSLSLLPFSTSSPDPIPPSCLQELPNHTYSIFLKII